MDIFWTLKVLLIDVLEQLLLGTCIQTWIFIQMQDSDEDLYMCISIITTSTTHYLFPFFFHVPFLLNLKILYMSITFWDLVWQFINWHHNK